MWGWAAGTTAIHVCFYTIPKSWSNSSWKGPPSPPSATPGTRPTVPGCPGCPLRGQLLHSQCPHPLVITSNTCLLPAIPTPGEIQINIADRLTISPHTELVFFFFFPSAAKKFEQITSKKNHIVTIFCSFFWKARRLVEAAGERQGLRAGANDVPRGSWGSSATSSLLCSSCWALLALPGQVFGGSEPPALCPAAIFFTVLQSFWKRKSSLPVPAGSQSRGSGAAPRRIFLRVPNPTLSCSLLPDLHVLKVLLSGNLVASKPSGFPAPAHMQSFVLGDAQ